MGKTYGLFINSIRDSSSIFCNSLRFSLDSLKTRQKPRIFIIHKNKSRFQISVSEPVTCVQDSNLCPEQRRFQISVISLVALLAFYKNVNVAGMVLPSIRSLHTGIFTPDAISHPW